MDTMGEVFSKMGEKIEKLYNTPEPAIVWLKRRQLEKLWFDVDFDQIETRVKEISGKK
jgi:hypothetical protein